MDYEDDFKETATGLWDLKKLEAEAEKLEKENLNQKAKPEIIYLPAKQIKEKKHESKRIYTFK